VFHFRNPVSVMLYKVHMRLGIVTSEEHATLLSDERALARALASHGINAVPAVWTNTAEPWSGFDALLIRTPWDYYKRVAEFEEWLTLIERVGVPMFNAVRTVRWNMHKAYLRELEQAGVDLPGSLFFARGEAVPALSDVMRTQGWHEVIVKPSVSAGAWDTFRSTGADDTRFRELAAKADTIVQEYCPAIETSGELSLVYIAGELCHAVRKVPKPSDFRVQEKHGGTSVRYMPTVADKQTAQHILDVTTRALGYEYLYARVDMVEHKGKLRLMELELIEPSLFLEYAPEKVEWMAERLASGMKRG
jgi:hypothetical protein